MVVFLEVVVVLWVVAVVLVVVVVLVVEVAAAHMAAKRSAVGMFVLTGGAGGVELGTFGLFVSMIAFVKGEDVEVLCALLYAFLGITCVFDVGNGVGMVLTTLFRISGVELLISVAAFCFSI